MIESFKRFRLQRKGLSCGKKRREREANCVVEFLRGSPVVMALLLGLSGCFLGWLVLYHPGLGVPHVDEPLKAVLVMLVVFLGAVLQFSVSQPESLQRNSRLLLVFGLLALHLGLMKLILGFVEDHHDERYKLLLLPYGLAPMALTILLGRGHGIFGAVFVSLWGALMIPEAKMLPWIVTSLCTGLVAVAASHEVRKRQHVLRAGLVVGLTALALALLFGHVRVLQPLGGWSTEWWRLFNEAAIVLGISLTTGIVVSSLLPVIESAFRITTSGTWMELSDLNHVLLRRMTIEAPGTYHHSLMVANLAEAAAEAIGANALRTRVSAYFHDIGKLKNPEYFIENQPPDDNPHNSMTPSMSALVVISHVKDGVDLALRHKLNREIIDVIEEHHGTSLVWFFYQRALEQRAKVRALADEDKAHETDVPEVEESTFRYPGPKPQTCETAIISLADAIESASRSMEKPTPAKIEQLVEEIVKGRILEGQLDESELTLSELEEVKNSFITTLRSMLHKRVAYTKAENESKSGAVKPITTATTRLGPRPPRFEVVRPPGEGSSGGRAA